MNYCLILAGGSGTRFWPYSRHKDPKQFLNVCSNRPMLLDTIHRINRLIKPQNIYLATNAAHGSKIKQCLKDIPIPIKNIIFEPVVKNTFAPIIFLSYAISQKDPGAVIIVVPSDHFIREASRFRKTLEQAIKVAKRGYIATLGIRPRKPQTGYGYIKIRSPRQCVSLPRGDHVTASPAFLVERFIEKPNLRRAKQFVKDKRYYWNSGIFIFKSSVILDEAKKFQPFAHKVITSIKDSKDFKKRWQKLPFISIDYALMEKSKKIALIPAHFSWSDVGDWKAMEEVMRQDKDGNILKGRAVALHCKNTLVFAGRRLVTALGLDDTVIIDTKDALLVCSKDKTQDVKKLVAMLKKKKLQKYL